MQPTSAGLDKKVDAVLSLFPSEFLRLSGAGQKVSVHAYRLLAKGTPVGLEDLAKEAGLREAQVRRILREWSGVYYDDAGRIIGYWGLALPEMAYRFEVEGRTLYTCCAWDSLFIPAILRKSARVESRCPETGTAIWLTVTPEGVQDRRPTDIVMSFLRPEAAKLRENLILHFCHYVHFFCSHDAGSRWVSKHPNTYLLSIEEAYHLGRQKNERQYQCLRDSMSNQRVRGTDERRT